MFGYSETFIGIERCLCACCTADRVRYADPPGDGQEYAKVCCDLYCRNHIDDSTPLKGEQLKAAYENLMSVLNGQWWAPGLVHYCSRAGTCCGGCGKLVKLALFGGRAIVDVCLDGPASTRFLAGVGGS
jgi:hypothetical protein